MLSVNVRQRIHSRKLQSAHKTSCKQEKLNVPPESTNVEQGGAVAATREAHVDGEVLGERGNEILAAVLVDVPPVGRDEPRLNCTSGSEKKKKEKKKEKKRHSTCTLSQEKRPNRS